MSRSPQRTPSLPALPLLLWRTPPGLELALAQEGVPFRNVRPTHPLALHAGRFLLFDSRAVSLATVRSRLSAEHVAIDIDRFRVGQEVDPFVALTDHKAAAGVWDVGGAVLSERVGRYDKAGIRKRFVSRLEKVVTRSGGVWAGLAPFPFPYRSAFNFRADLDETDVDDYARFARARRRLDDCSTHFVSTRAYGDEPDVLGDLRGLDAQSHGHHHVVYRDPEANRRNLLRADETLRQAGFEPNGFAAPHGRWNLGLDRVLEDLGYEFSSDFQLGRDDVPFFPWCGDRFSNILQVPIHPVCEGLFSEAGVEGGEAVADHLAAVVLAKVASGEPAFVYGHPERRLARLPNVLEALADAVEGNALLWRVTLTEFARWWRWRLGRSWSMVPKPDGRLEVQFDEWSAAYPLGLIISRGDRRCHLPLTGPRTSLRLDDLAYERHRPGPTVPTPRFPAVKPSLRAALRSALDWETVTPLDELPSDSIPALVKKGLRTFRQSRLDRRPEGVTS